MSTRYSFPLACAWLVTSGCGFPQSTWAGRYGERSREEMLIVVDRKQVPRGFSCLSASSQHVRVQELTRNQVALESSIHPKRCQHLCLREKESQLKRFCRKKWVVNSSRYQVSLFHVVWKIHSFLDWKKVGVSMVRTARPLQALLISIYFNLF